MTSSEQSAKATCSPLTHTQTPDPELRLRWRYKVEIRVNENTKWQIGMERNCANQSWGLLTNPIVTQTHTRSWTQTKLRLSWREIQRIESWPKVQNNCRSWTPGTLAFRMFGSAMLLGIGSTLLGIGMGKASLNSGPVSSDHICIQRPPMVPPAKDNPQLNSSCKRLKILSWIPWRRIMITSLFTTAPICCKNW